MGEPLPTQAGPPEVTATSTVTVEQTDTQDGVVPTVTVKLVKPKTDRKVQWATETVDNEDMNKKKSKCCCIYTKPRLFGESSSSDSSDDEGEHCSGHVEKKKKKYHNHHHHHNHAQQQTPEPSPTITVTDNGTPKEEKQEYPNNANSIHSNEKEHTE